MKIFLFADVENVKNPFHGDSFVDAFATIIVICVSAVMSWRLMCLQFTILRTNSFCSYISNWNLLHCYL